jgi:hypothetical protein
MEIEAPPRVDLTLSADELRQITGYTMPAKQVEELRRQGFWRARRNVAGAVVLERRHYDAVCAGAAAPAPDTAGPRLRIPPLRRPA